MSFLSRSSYPFVVSFDNTPQRPFRFEFLIKIRSYTMWRLSFFSCLAFLVISVEVLKALLPASEIFCILSSVLFLLSCLGLLKRLDIGRECALESWLRGLLVLKEVFNILYLCMSFLSRSSYPFVVSFDNTPQQPFHFEFQKNMKKKINLLLKWVSFNQRDTLYCVACILNWNSNFFCKNLLIMK